MGLGERFQGHQEMISATRKVATSHVRPIERTALQA